MGARSLCMRASADKSDNYMGASGIGGPLNRWEEELVYIGVYILVGKIGAKGF